MSRILIQHKFMYWLKICIDTKICQILRWGEWTAATVSMDNRNHPQVTLIQVFEMASFTHMYIHIYIYTSYQDRHTYIILFICNQAQYDHNTHICAHVYLHMHQKCLRTYLHVYKYIYLSIYLSIHPSIYLSIHRSIHPSIYLSEKKQFCGTSSKNTS